MNPESTSHGLSQGQGAQVTPAIADENDDGALFGGGISRSETALAIVAAVDLIDDVQSQVAILTLWADDNRGYSRSVQFPKRGVKRFKPEQSEEDRMFCCENLFRISDSIYA
jgi:hypothetical protein